MEAFQLIEFHLREPGTALPDTLAVCFEAFEGIRLMARAHEIAVPELFAAFMTAADAAVEGREALTAALSLPYERSAVRSAGTAPSATAGQAADAICHLAALLGGRLMAAAAGAGTPGDKKACQQAAAAARRIHRLMAPASDDADLR